MLNVEVKTFGRVVTATLVSILMFAPISASSNQPPLAQSFNKKLNEDTKVAIALKGKDPEHKKLSYLLFKSPEHGSISLKGGSVVYRPELNYFGLDSFQYLVSDGINQSLPGLVSLVINPVNDAPIAIPQQLVVNKGASAIITLSATDVDSPSISYSISTKPKKGTVKLTNNSVLYTPKSPLFQGTDVFFFKAKDQKNKLSKAAQINLTISDSCPAQRGFKDGVCTATSPNPQPVSAVLLNDVIEPVSLVNVSVPDAPSGSGATQVSGPEVSALSYNNGHLHFISTPDAGKAYTLGFKLGNESLKQYNLQFEPRFISTIETGSEAGDEGAAPSSDVSEDITASINGLVNSIILPGKFSELGFSLADKAGRVAIKPENYELHLHAGNFVSIKDYFELSADHSALQLSGNTNAAALAGLLRNGINSIELSGEDSKGRYFAFEFSFAYATNSISGKIVNSIQQAVSPPTGASVSLKGLATNVTLNAPIAADGSFQFPNVPTDSYEINLLDPSETNTGTSLFGIEGANKTVNVDLLVNNISVQAAKNSAVIKSIKTQNQPILSGSKVSITDDTGSFSISKYPKRVVQKQQFSSPQADEISLGQVLATSAQENQTIQDVKNITIPQGTGNVTVAVKVGTSEYPGYTTNPGNPYNDSWRYQWSCGGFSDSKSNRVNISHSSIGTRSFNKTIDLTAATAQGSIVCNIAAFTTNIGDSALATNVEIAIKNATGLSVKTFRHTSGLFKDKNNTYHMGVPVQTGALGTRRKFKVDIEYLPKEADISSLKLELLHGQAKVLVTEQQSFNKIENGLLRAEITLPEIALIPDASVLAQLTATLTGTIGGTITKTEANALSFDTGADTFAVLFETTNVSSTPASRRYDNRNNSEGSDGWGRMLMHNYLQTGLGKNLIFNDISGEHAWQSLVNGTMKSLGVHKEHKAGLTLDARYVDENGQNATAMQGNGNGESILATLQAAQQETATNAASKPNALKIVQWIDQNRAFLEALSLDGSTTKIYIGVASWHQNALIQGKFPDGTKIPRPGQFNPDNTPVFMEVWNKPQKVTPMAGNHEGHIHVGMD